MLQQLQLESGESFDYKQGYEYAIYEVHKQYSLRRKKNTKVPPKKSTETQTKKIVEAPGIKILQILPRGAHEASSPKMVEITSIEIQTSATPQTSNATQTVPNNKIENKTVGTQTELPSDGKENKNINHNY